ncbi:MAG: hypothetical protein WDM78_01515 [Puia sp.]
MRETDPVLSSLSAMLINRRLLKAKLQAEPFAGSLLEKYLNEAALLLNISKKDAAYFVFTGEHKQYDV